MSRSERRLPESFFLRETDVVAADLIGRHLRRGPVRLRITETEAYMGPWDTACHARSGRTKRNDAIWGPPGRTYIYLCYGLHMMLNLVTREDGEASAVLIRAAEPVEGLDTIRARRGGKDGPVMLTGPGKVGAALALDLALNHHPVFEAGGLEALQGEGTTSVLVGPRVGIDYAEPEHRDAPYRFALPGSCWVTVRKTLKVHKAAGSRAALSPPPRSR